ncbi:MAG: dihydrolipoyl dehydrogenase [Candidatus Neomarinimicrobiota bacterium]
MKYDVIIIGSGPAGYVAAIRSGQLGLKAAIVEKNDLGGMCLNWGCIPTKSIIESAKIFYKMQKVSEFGVTGIDKNAIAFDWKIAKKRSERIVHRLTKGVELLIKKNGVDIINGLAAIKSENSIIVEKQLYETDNIIIATGSKPTILTDTIPNTSVTSIRDLLKMDELPNNPVIVGCNPHAVELVQFFNLIGRKVVLLVSHSTLIPDADKYLSDFLLNSFKKDKIKVVFEEKIKSYIDGILKTDKSEFQTDCLINGNDRQAILPDYKIDLALDNNFIKVNGLLQTNYESIFAIGDVNGTSKFAHTASAQGLHAANVISGVKKEFDNSKFPINIYTYPEMAQIGMTEKQLTEEEFDYKVSEFPLTANGKAMIEGQRNGLIRLLSDKKYGEVLGVQIIANNATDLIAEAGVLMQLEGTVYDVANTIHAHPTISEIYMEAGFDAFEQPIHK